ncbi:hypothetical protein NLJ89_g11591 [Agrocybe chaxingu]|uniref:AB hydrolase-1 domain-containing protein n=1 Tax=Agrocybe chaxingu TaxID=84603 RepID=A0A9W8MPV8_9AGAR|nr:hypothetical protein NLJ89_g11591 [Agrocybe chaxingu]
MEPNAYPRVPFTWEPVEPRKPLPIYPPPEPLESLPALPSPPRKPIFDAPYTLSTHVFPAAYLRTTRLAPEPPLPPPNASKEERKRAIAEVQRQLTALRTSKVTEGYPRLLWNCVNRRIWEPTLGLLLASPAASVIDEVWCWESVQHGDAALINAHMASGIFDWQDNGRDIANFLLHFLPKAATSDPLPTHLPRVSREETGLRIKNGYKDRKFVAVGHSYGGCTSALAAHLYPALFSALILLDPVIAKPFEHDPKDRPVDLAAAALNRRETWPSREEALQSFKRNPFFQIWDPAVVQVYVDCGTYITKDATGKEVAKLKMTSMQEAVVFSEVHTEYEVFQRMVTLDERIPLRWVMPGRPGAQEIGGPGASKFRVWVRPANSTNCRIKGAGHLIPQEAPRELAEELSRYLLYLFSTPTSYRKANL